MKALTIRNIPDDLYETLAGLARQNRRSLQQQVLVFLDRARLISSDPPTDRAREIRQRLQGRNLGDTVQEIRQERQR